MSKKEKKPVKKAAATVVKAEERKPIPTWNQIGDGFETLGKIGIAAAIGLSAAGIFCRLADQGKVTVPNLTGLVLNRGDQPRPAAKAQGGDKKK